jgi:hypothetical protein
METVQVKNWQLEVDPAATERAQALREAGGPESCGCLHCRNFATARNVAYPAEFVQLLGRLGVPPDRESEIYHCGEVEPGLHFYGGWFHFVGRIVSGPDALSGGPPACAIELEKISDRFSFGFTNKLGLVPTSFPAGTVGQLEFSAKVPWVLSEPCVG